jgi:hypothetical protein
MEAVDARRRSSTTVLPQWMGRAQSGSGRDPDARCVHSELTLRCDRCHARSAENARGVAHRLFSIACCVRHDTEGWAMAGCRDAEQLA